MEWTFLKNSEIKRLTFNYPEKYEDKIITLQKINIAQYFLLFDYSKQQQKEKEKKRTYREAESQNVKLVLETKSRVPCHPFHESKFVSPMH